MNQLASHTGINLYTDGASRGNPGRGGFGGVLVIDEQVAEFGGREDLTTNNRMELMAVIEGFRKVVSTNSTTGRKPIPEPVEGSAITVHTDSAYVLNGATKWIYGWQKNNWITSTKSEVLNKDLWSELANLQQQLSKSYEISWVKVKGHSGHPENERCDVIATSFADKEEIELFSGSLEKYEKEILNEWCRQAQPPAANRSLSLSKGPVETKPKKAKDSRPAFSYVSLVDGVFHADKTWGECEKRVKGTKGAKYKKVYSPGEESEMRKEWK